MAPSPPHRSAQPHPTPQAAASASLFGGAAARAPAPHLPAAPAATSSSSPPSSVRADHTDYARSPMRMKMTRRPPALATVPRSRRRRVAVAACGSSSEHHSDECERVRERRPAAVPPRASGRRSLRRISHVLGEAGRHLAAAPGGHAAPSAGGGSSAAALAGRWRLRQRRKPRSAPRCRSAAAGSAGGRRSLRRPRAVAALTKFAACMRSNGIDLSDAKHLR